MAEALPREFQINNFLLNMLPAAELKRIRARLELVKLGVKDVLITAGAPVTAVHFIDSGVISMISLLEDGAGVEVGVAGSEGMIGLPLLLGAETSAVEAMVQVAGEAWRLSAPAFRQALSDAPALMPLLLRYVDSFGVQVSQTAACNSRHQIEQRLARWLLMTRDRVDTDSFVMTQEFLSTLLGLDQQGLEAAACECYQVVNRRFAWLRPPRSKPVSEAG